MFFILENCLLPAIFDSRKPLIFEEGEAMVLVFCNSLCPHFALTGSLSRDGVEGLGGKLQCERVMTLK